MKFSQAILLSFFVIALLSPTIFQYVPIARAQDTTPPNTSLTPFSPDPTNDNTPRYSGSATDDMSDIVRIQYRVDGGTWRNVDPFTPARSVSFTFTTTTLSDGTHTIRTKARDNAGNWETSYASDTITVDTTSPPTPTVSSSTHPNVDRWYSNNDPSFTWTTPSDDSGIEGYSYSLDQSPSTTPDRSIDTTGNSVSYTNKDDRIWYFHVRAQDRAGNWGPADHYGVRIDTEEPSASISINEDAEYTDSTSVTLTLSYSDTLSGVKDCQYRNQEGSWTSWEPCRNTKSWDLTSGDEYKTVYYQVRDNAENIERVSASIILDTGGPPRPAISSSTHQNEDNWYSNNDPSFSWAEPSDVSGIEGYSYVLDKSSSTNPDSTTDTSGRSKSYSNLADGTWYFHVKARDNAGNWGQTDHYKINIDTTPPGPTSPKAEPGGWTNQKYVKISWSAVEEEGSGVHHYEYRVDSTSGSWTSVGISTNFEVPPQSSGVHRVYVRAVDNVGLVGDVGDVQFYIDLGVPTTPSPLLPDKGIHLDVGPTFSWSPADDPVSGVASYTLQIDSSSSFDSVELEEFSGITAANYTLGDSMSFGKWYWRVYAVDKAGNKGGFSDVFNLISDRIMINHGGVTDDRVDLGVSSIVWFTAIYEYDGINLDSSKGSLYVNDLEMTWNEENSRWEKSFSYTGVSKHNFRVNSVKDLTYGLTTLDDQVSVKSIIWDRVNIELTASDSRINIGDTANITWTGVYEFDRRSFTDNLSLNDTKTKTIVGEYGYKVKTISDSKYGLTVFQSNAVSVVFDRINIKISVSDDRINIGSEAPISWTGIYEYDETIFNGTTTYNNTQTIFDSVGRRGYTISSVNDPRYNITVFRSNHEYIIWDRIKIIDGGVSSPSTYVNQAEIVWFQAAYEYDDVIFDGSSGTLYLNGSAMTWSVNNRWELGFLFDDPDTKKFRVSSVSDTRYNLKTLNDMVGIQSIAWYVPTTYTIFLTPSSSYNGFKVDIDGSLTYQNASGVQGARIILSYSVDEGKTWIEIPHVTSDLSGAYSSVWIPPDPGNYRIRAVLESDIWMGREEQWNLYLTSFKDQYVFPILSNSTVSDLIYDPTTRELRFTVSGPLDTVGYSSVFIGSALAPGITDIKVYLDGEAQSFNSRSAGDSWLLRFPYSHSTSHFVKISLRSPTMLWTLLAVGLAACVFVVIVLEQRIKKQYVNRM